MVLERKRCCYLRSLWIWILVLSRGTMFTSTLSILVLILTHWTLFAGRLFIIILVLSLHTRFTWTTYMYIVCIVADAIFRLRIITSSIMTIRVPMKATTPHAASLWQPTPTSAGCSRQSLTNSVAIAISESGNHFLSTNRRTKSRICSCILYNVSFVADAIISRRISTRSVMTIRVPMNATTPPTTSFG